MYQYVLFDLDGTLTDSVLGITNSVMYALEQFGIREEDRTKLYKFIGPPLRDSFAEFYGFDETQIEAAVRYYQERYGTKGVYENEVYDGIEELLKTLKKHGCSLIVATSKPEKFAIEIIKYFHLDSYFDLVVGATMDHTRNKKAEVIDYVLKEAKITDRSKAVMIGDREHDIIGAKEMHLDSIGVLYGYGTKEELMEAGATYIAKDPADVIPYVLGNSDELLTNQQNL